MIVVMLMLFYNWDNLSHYYLHEDREYQNLTGYWSEHNDNQHNVQSSNWDFCPKFVSPYLLDAQFF